jgi:hypothetical protein
MVALRLQSLPFLCLQKSALVLATPKQLIQIPIVVLVNIEPSASNRTTAAFNPAEQARCNESGGGWMSFQLFWISCMPYILLQLFRYRPRSGGLSSAETLPHQVRSAGTSHRRLTIDQCSFLRVSPREPVTPTACDDIEALPTAIVNRPVFPAGV